jgi:hypothetical protein
MVEELSFELIDVQLLCHTLEVSCSGFYACHNRVSRIMKQNNIQGVGRKKFKPQTTTSNHDLPIAKLITC